MIHLSMSACRPSDTPSAEFDVYFRTRHVEFAKRLEGLRLLSAVRVQQFSAGLVTDAGAVPAWVLDVWWSDADAATHCLRSPGGMALIGDRMVAMDDPIPAVADVSEQVRHAAAADAMFDPSTGPRVTAGTAKLHVLIPTERSDDVDAVVDSWQSDSPSDAHSGVGAWSVGRREGAAFPLNRVITGIDPPLLPRNAQRGTSLELWLRPGTALDEVATAGSRLRSLLDDEHVTWWFGESYEVMMSLLVSSFIALDPDRSVA